MEPSACEVRAALHAVNGQIPNQRSTVVLSLASRVDETAAAIRLLLCHKHSFIDDAGTLLRTLIEHVIDVGFIAANDRSLAGKYVAYGDVEAAKHDEKRRLNFPEMQAASIPKEYGKARDESLALFQISRKSVLRGTKLCMRGQKRRMKTMEIDGSHTCTRQCMGFCRHGYMAIASLPLKEFTLERLM